MNKSLSRKLVDKPYIVWSVLFIIAPLVMVLYYAFTDTSGAFFAFKYKRNPRLHIHVFYFRLFTV